MAQTLESLNNDAEFDVLIIGAGMVGASTALGVKKLGLKVLLIDAFSFQSAAADKSAAPDYTPSYDARSTAISWGSRDILSRLNVWDEVKQHACAISHVHVSEKGRFGITRMNAAELKQAALGYVVPNQWLGQCLLRNIEAQKIPLCAPAKVIEIKTNQGRQVVTLTQPDDKKISKQVSAPLLIIADGTCSTTADLLGIENTIEQYGQHALIANVSTELPNNGVAYERFTREGPLALLPLTETTSALVWTHNSEHIQTFLDMSDDDFCQALQAAFGERLGRITKCGARNAYPLRLVRAKEQFRPGILLLGNAAHSLHPVAGQGFNLALRGVASFLETLNRTVKSQENIADLSVLRVMCEQRIQDQSTTILFSDQVVKVFGHNSSLVGFVRDAGLIALDNIPILKSVFASQAMGLAGKKAQF